MSNHDYDGCHDQACDLCAAYAAGKDKARWELGQPDAVLICSCLPCKHTRRVAVMHFVSPQTPLNSLITPATCHSDFTYYLL